MTSTRERQPSLVRMLRTCMRCDRRWSGARPPGGGHPRRPRSRRHAGASRRGRRGCRGRRSAEGGAERLDLLPVDVHLCRADAKLEEAVGEVADEEHDAVPDEADRGQRHQPGPGPQHAGHGGVGSSGDRGGVAIPCSLLPWTASGQEQPDRGTCRKETAVFSASSGAPEASGGYSEPHRMPASSLHLGHTGNRCGSRTGWNRRRTGGRSIVLRTEQAFDGGCHACCVPPGHALAFAFLPAGVGRSSSSRLGDASRPRSILARQPASAVP